MSGSPAHPERPREQRTERGGPAGWSVLPRPISDPRVGAPSPGGGPPSRDQGWGPPPGFTPLEASGISYVPEATPGPSLPLASWGQRAGALLVDSVILWVSAALLIAAFAAAKATSLGVLVALVGNFAYFALLDGKAQTIGKRMVGIAVRDERGGGLIGSRRALGRWAIYSVLWCLLFVPGLLNALAPLWDQQHQAWHDRAVSSVVVQLR